MAWYNDESDKARRREEQVRDDAEIIRQVTFEEEQMLKALGVKF